MTASSQTAAATTVASPQGARLTSLDAFRGAIMLLMASGGLGFPQIAKSFPDNAMWQFIGRQCDHTMWSGCTLWDLIQPAFMFMVGVALPWSVANRQARGESIGSMFGHALWRSLILILLAVFLSSAWSRQTEWIFPNVLAQIGLGYPILFLLAFTSTRTTWLAAFGILFLSWLAFALHPLPAPGFDWKAVGVPENWPHFSGWAAHWEKNANFAAGFDLWFLNLFPRAKPFTFNAGGYQTLNFVPALATMIFGLLAGRLLRSELSRRVQLRRLVLAGFVGIALGLLLGLTGLCPIVKRIWTPSWALFSTGLVALILAAFVAVVDGRGHKRWVFPFVVVGLNPITFYCLSQLSGPFVKQQIQIHFGQSIFASFGETWVPALERGATLFVFWLIVFWMYRRKIFLRI